MGKLHQATACLRFFGDDLEPVKLSSQLGLKASHSWRKGELWSKQGQGRLRETGAWVLNGRWDQRCDINDQISDIFDRLSKEVEIWNELNSSFYADVYCGMFLAEYTGSSGLSVATMKRLTDRGLQLNIKIYQRETGGNGLMHRFPR